MNIYDMTQCNGNWGNDSVFWVLRPLRIYILATLPRVTFINEIDQFICIFAMTHVFFILVP